MIRRSCWIFLFAAASAFAQTGAPKPKLEPLPPPPPMSESDEPAIRIPVQKTDKVEVWREGGRVVMVRVTPPGGAPYYLVDTAGNGNWVRRDALDDGVRVPMWQIYTFD